MSAHPIRIGTAGWSIPARYAADFPADGTHLQRYAGRLNAAEINSSFYRPHRRQTYEKWAASVPEDFRFTVKMPKAITHASRLKECGMLTAQFLSEAEGLGAKLDVLLVQLPPSLAFDNTVAAEFFRDLHGRTDAAIACEPRHASWFTGRADDCLAGLEVARVAADPPPASGADSPGGWKGLVYYRLHGSPRMYYSDYGEAALEAVASRLTNCAVPAWCIFDNTAAFAALGNATRVTEMTSTRRPRAPAAAP